MEISNSSRSNLLKKESLHSQIYIAHDTDPVYRKPYKGDWGHWDDLPDHKPTNANSDEISENENLTVSDRIKITAPYENCYL